MSFLIHRKEISFIRFRLFQINREKGITFMVYDAFIEKMMETVRKEFTEETEVNLTTVQKNNGVMLKGLMIKEKGVNTAPAIYLEAYYQMYREGKSLGEILKDFMLAYGEARQRGEFDVRLFTQFEKARHRILYKLVNYERNVELLEQIPHVRFLDLAVVFYYLVEKQHMGSAIILIRNTHMEYWGVDCDEIYGWAKKNTPTQMPSEIMRMSELLQETLDIEVPLEQDAPMYILSNSQRNLGASCMLYPDILKNFGGMIENDFYILPSSIHEVILLPVCEAENPVILQEMVKEVNQSQVELQEQLSDQVYLYERETARVKICC